MLLSRGKITEDLIDMMMGWQHFWFNVYCRPRIQPDEEEAWITWPAILVCLYLWRIIRASFSQESPL